MKGAHFFIALTGIAVWFIAALCFATDADVVSSTDDIRLKIPANVNVRRVPVAEHGWSLGRVDEVEIVGSNLNVPVAAQVVAVTTTSDPLGVQTVADMRKFARNVAERDANIKLIVVNPKATEVDYAMPGKLFGVMPIKIIISVSMDESGNARVKLPWYGIFVKMAAKFDAWDISQALDERIASAPRDEFSRQAWTVQALAAVIRGYEEGK